jgi:sugar lactone lactonase YvrE
MQQIDCIIKLEHSDNGQPVWIESQKSLFWVDHANQKLYQYQADTQEIITCEVDAPILSLSPSMHHGFIATLEDGIGFYDIQSRRVTYISKPEPFASNKQTIAGITDKYGNYWSFTQPKSPGSKQGNLYQLTPKMDMQRVTGEDWECTAPPAFSKDGSILYQSSGTTRYIYATRLNEQRQPVETINFCRISKQDGYPHGLCVDNDDCLWVCHRGAGYISRYNQSGECLEKIKIEAPGVKYCAFGGPQLDTLFIVTSGSEDLTRSRRKIQLADTVLSLKPGVAGIQPYQFAG